MLFIKYYLISNIKEEERCNKYWKENKYKEMKKDTEKEKRKKERKKGKER